ncbi:MAG: TauD/TfdA family dioxygenase [Ectothiorhodospiraceae bacterium]|nr:TauD/TfdA family dioxygenase [Chromatiales bacterium]MCP5153651.1 TauD/TfdA family dioxygenase [Ectothiorhodospiraceae bacterium]
MEIRRLSPALGSEVVGVDVTRVDDAGFAALRAAWLDAGGLLVLRDQRLSPEQHLAFSRRFGPLFGEAEQLQRSVEPYLLPGHPGVYRVSNKVRDGVPQGRARAGAYWHSDVSFRERPAMASLLHAIELPPRGGDTLFNSMHTAYEALSPALQALLRGLHAVHDFAVADRSSWGQVRISDGDLDGENRCLHPVVITHPETGRKALFVNPGFTSHLDGFSAEESKGLLQLLYRLAIREEFQYRHVWSPRDLLVWDNRSVMHHAVVDYEGVGERYLHRTTTIAARPAA